MDFNVADLFEAAVDRVPDREILVCGPERRTYAQLDALVVGVPDERWGNRVAVVVQARGG